MIPAGNVTTLPTCDVGGYGGHRPVGTIGIGGMGWSVYDATGPAVAMKTWGHRARRSDSGLQGLGGALSTTVALGGDADAQLSGRSGGS